jgi:hypothetical protein
MNDFFSSRSWRWMSVALILACAGILFASGRYLPIDLPIRLIAVITILIVSGINLLRDRLT